MLGPPTFPENPVPTWNELVSDYVEHILTVPSRYWAAASSSK
ncbi:hypothetical protein [Larkinella arboricola]